MKKILTVSLFAMLAVSAANADIASTAYVEGQTGTLTNLTTTAKGNLVAAINEVDANIGSVSFEENTPMSKATNLTDAIVAVNAQINAMSGELTSNLQGSINELDGTVSAMDTAYKAADTALGNRLTTAEGKITTIEGQQTTQDGKISALETSLSATGTTGKAIADNKKAIADMDTAYKAADTTTLNSAKAFTTEQIEALGKLATIDTACAQGVTDCALVIRSGEIKWEKVSY